jgi:hypothetical protein
MGDAISTDIKTAYTDVLRLREDMADGVPQQSPREPVQEPVQVSPPVQSDFGE